LQEPTKQQVVLDLSKNISAFTEIKQNDIINLTLLRRTRLRQITYFLF